MVLSKRIARFFFFFFSNVKKIITEFKSERNYSSTVALLIEEILNKSNQISVFAESGKPAYPKKTSRCRVD